MQSEEVRKMKLLNSLGWNFSLAMLLLFVCSIVANGQKTRVSQQENKSNSPFRYVIVENTFDKDENPELNSRAVEVLLDGKAFSEKNLKTLFALVSKRFPKSDQLYIWVYTSLEQIPTPEEKDGGATSESNEVNSNKYYWAVYLRNEGDEFFRYSPVNDKSDLKTIQLTSNQK
jgi:hypothetical protein